MIGAGSAKVIFKADFETGDLSQWSTTGIRGKNTTPRNFQVVTDIVREGKFAGKFTIHEDDVFNAQQLRVPSGLVTELVTSFAFVIQRSTMQACTS